MKTLMMLSLLISGAANASTLTLWACYGNEVNAVVNMNIVPGGVSKMRMMVRDAASNALVANLPVESLAVVQTTSRKIQADYRGMNDSYKMGLTITTMPMSGAGGYKSMLKVASAEHGRTYMMSCMRTRAPM